MFSACRKNTISGTHTHTKTKQTAPASQAMIDSIKSNSATGAHFKVNLSQHFDIFKNKACQVYFRFSFELLPQLKKNVPLTKRFQFRSVERELWGFMLFLRHLQSPYTAMSEKSWLFRVQQSITGTSWACRTAAWCSVSTKHCSPVLDFILCVTVESLF